MLIDIPETVGEIMTREVAWLDENDTLANLKEAMRALRFRHMPVTDDGRLIGLISERDLLRISTSTLMPHHREQDRALSGRFRVRDIMTENVATVSEETPLAQAGRLLLTNQFGCLPVVKADNALVGIVTRSDYIRAVVDAAQRV